MTPQTTLTGRVDGEPGRRLVPLSIRVPESVPSALGRRFRYAGWAFCLRRRNPSAARFSLESQCTHIQSWNRPRVSRQKEGMPVAPRPRWQGPPFPGFAETCIMYIRMSIPVGIMAARHSIAEARRNFPALVRDAESGRAVELTRRGKPVAVLLGHREFERLASGRRGFGKAYQEFLRTTALAELSIDPEETFGDARDGTTGRDVQL